MQNHNTHFLAGAHRNRYRNLLALLKRYPSMRRFADAVGVRPGYVSQLLRHRPMGRKVAERMERALRLPSGWMDEEHAQDGSAVRQAEGEQGAGASRHDVARPDVRRLMDEIRDAAERGRLDAAEVQALRSVLHAMRRGQAK